MEDVVTKYASSIFSKFWLLLFRLTKGKIVRLSSAGRMWTYRVGCVCLGPTKPLVAGPEGPRIEHGKGVRCTE